MNNKIALCLLFSLFLISSCKRHRLAKSREMAGKIDLPGETGADSSEAGLIPLPATWITEADFNYLAARSKLTITGKLQNVDNAGVNIRMKKDSVIWLSVAALGFEVMRALITTEGVRVQDKFHKVYSELDYPSLTRRLGFPVDFRLIQTAVLGNLPLAAGSPVRMRSADSALYLGYEQDSLRMTARVDTTRKTVAQLEAMDVKAGNYLKILYGDFQPVEAALVPYLVELTLRVRPKLFPDRTDTSFIRLVHTKIESSNTPLTFPFTIPNNYKRAH